MVCGTPPAAITHMHTRVEIDSKGRTRYPVNVLCVGIPNDSISVYLCPPALFLAFIVFYVPLFVLLMYLGDCIVALYAARLPPVVTPTPFANISCRVSSRASVPSILCMFIGEKNRRIQGYANFLIFQLFLVVSHFMNIMLIGLDS
jgi:hypothetical protein